MAKTQLRQILFFFLIIGFFIFSMIWAYKAVFISTKSLPLVWRWVTSILYWVITLAPFGLWFYAGRHWREFEQQYPGLRELILGAFITVFVTVLVIAIFHFIEDIVWLVKWAGRKLSANSSSGGEKISRGLFISKVGFGLGALTFGSFAWGLTKGKYSFRVMKERLAFKNLPAGFDGVKIVQISDAHLDAFENKHEEIQGLVEMVNEQEADYIVFTGDLITSYTTEAEPWIEHFSSMKAKYGKYAILGNHDYGYFGVEDTDQEKIKQGVIDTLGEMGFSVLMNEHTMLEHAGDRIALAGVEIWSKSEEWWPKVGDLQKAMSGTEDAPFKILLTHDPTHWEEEVMGKEDIDLTLSGHTHGAQIGLRIPGLFQVSPARFLFKRWAGLYSEGNQHLYINRGLGYLIFPGRVGMAPEITVLELSKA
jgi:predicted MPP superfamily phosphohydrolase